MDQLRAGVRPTVSYGVTGALVILVVCEILAGTIFGVDPAPQIPPDGYVAHEERIRLSWRSGDHDGEFAVQVAVDGDFEQLVLSKKTRKTSLVLPRLDRGKKYCWRVLDDADAVTSCFETTPAMIPYR